MKLVLLRHGESTWNRQNRFTGWTDVTLTEKGKAEAKSAGALLKDFQFDIVFTSLQKRALQTTNIVLKQLYQTPKIVRSWRLNERHYGALQGLNKSEMAKKFGEAQVHIWRRSYDIPPPPLKKSDKRFPGNQSLYKNIPKKYLPLTESLKDTVARVIPFWRSDILPALKKNQSVLVSAHGNSLRALVKYLDNTPEEQITSVNIPTGIPLVYELDKSFRPVRHYFLGSKREIQKRLKAVEKQGKAKP